jgi:hypothetical protein
MKKIIIATLFLLSSIQAVSADQDTKSSSFEAWFQDFLNQDGSSKDGIAKDFALPDASIVRASAAAAALGDVPASKSSTLREKDKRKIENCSNQLPAQVFAAGDAKRAVENLKKALGGSPLKKRHPRRKTLEAIQEALAGQKGMLIHNDAN